jgi:hypothetical protein
MLTDEYYRNHANGACVPGFSFFAGKDPSMFRVLPRLFAVALVCGTVLLTLSACKSSHEEGVKSSYRSQWVTVSADTQNTTEAAKAVLEAEGLKDVRASSTNVDGKASGKKADDTKVSVSIEKTGDKTSQVSVNVGTLGDPSLGAEIAKKIKDRAEGR